MVELNATLIAQIINFLILVFILKKIFYKPLLRAMADRQARISETIEAADADKIEAENLRREYTSQLNAARMQAQNIVEKATKLAEQNREEILAQARAEHARLLEEAREEIAREKQRALAEMRDEVVSLSVACAGKIIERNLDSEANAKLVEDFLVKLDERKTGGLTC